MNTKRTTPEIRFFRFVKKTNRCWKWVGSVNDNGYGQFNNGETMVKSHQFVYELMVGPIPKGKVLDHTCHDPKLCPGGPSCPHRRCVNPTHLDPVTRGENVRRGVAGIWLFKEFCDRGHKLPNGQLDGVRKTVDGRVRRFCLQCTSEQQKKAYERRKKTAGGKAVRSSEYRGVDFYAVKGRWRSRIRRNDVLHHLGYFDSELEAAQAYEEAAKKLTARG